MLRGKTHKRKAKPKDSKKVFKLLIAQLGKHKTLVNLGVIASFIGAILGVIAPLWLGDMINMAQKAIENNEEIDMNRIRQMGFILIFTNFGAVLFNYIANHIVVGVTQIISKNLRSDISTKINKLPLKYFDSTPYGDILSRVTNDIDNVSQNLSQALLSIVGQTTTLIGIIIFMLVISVQLTLIAIVSIPVSMILVVIIVKMSQKHFVAQQKVLGELNGHVEEAYSGHIIVKAFNKDKDNLVDFSNYNEKLQDSAWKSQFFSGLMMPATFFVGNLAFISISIVAGLLAVSANNISINFFFWNDGLILTGPLLIGAVQSFLIYIRKFNQPIQQLAQISNVLQSCFAASGRIFEFLNEPELPHEQHKQVLNKKDVKGNVEFRGVNFGYSDDKQIIFDFNIKVQPGQKVAIVGPTGAGKTTIVNLLMRFYEVNSGSILIDNIKTTDLTRENTASLFGMVLQDTWLYEATILENLKFSSKDATFEDVKKACIACDINHFIKSLPNGYNYMLDENANISQGQKQLMTIARAMIANSPMLILDEATSSVDTRTEVRIQSAMDELMKGRTSFVIAHRLSTIKNADIILVMDKGNIIESGNHEKLLAQNGFYTNLYNSQFQEESE